MNRLETKRFFPYTLGNWLKQSQDAEMWSFDVKNNRVIAQSNDTFRIFDRVSQTTSRKKEGTFTYSKTLKNYTAKRISTTVNRQGCKPNVVFMTYYRDKDDSYYGNNDAKKLWMIDTYEQITITKQNKIEQASQKGCIRVVLDTFYIYTQNQDVSAAAWNMNTKSIQQRLEGSRLINGE